MSANENGKADRLNRIEAILDKVGDRLDKLSMSVYLHEQRIADHEERYEERQKALEEQMAETDRRLRASGEAIDLRIEKLVVAIGEFISELKASR